MLAGDAVVGALTAGPAAAVASWPLTWPILLLLLGFALSLSTRHSGARQKGKAKAVLTVPSSPVSSDRLLQMRDLALHTGRSRSASARRSGGCVSASGGATPSVLSGSSGGRQARGRHRAPPPIDCRGLAGKSAGPGLRWAFLSASSSFPLARATADGLKSLASRRAAKEDPDLARKDPALLADLARKDPALLADLACRLPSSPGKVPRPGPGCGKGLVGMLQGWRAASGCVRGVQEFTRASPLSSRAPSPAPLRRRNRSAPPKRPGVPTIDEAIAAGVPDGLVEGVRLLATSLSVTGTEPLCDPLSLLRFLKAREEDVQGAADMYRSTLEWRRSCGLDKLMALHGTGEPYLPSGVRASSLATPWGWRRRTAGPGASLEALLVQEYGGWGRVRCNHASEEGPVAVWRLGAIDFAGVDREGLTQPFIMAFAVHLEELFQAGRVCSVRQGRLVQARLVVDLKGASLKVLKHRKHLMDLVHICKSHYPEVFASATLVNSPSIFSTIWCFIQPLLSGTMKKKVCILGTDFEEECEKHSGVSMRDLPAFLGGEVEDSCVGLAHEVPKGAGEVLRSAVQCDVKREVQV